MSTNLASAATGSRRDRERREFSRECVDFFAETVQVFGVPKSVGQIYGLLFASAEPLSFSNIVEQLTISKGSASQGLQLLRSLGAIHDAGAIKDAERRRREASDGASRRVTYVPELRLRRLVSGVLGERVAPLATGGQERLARLRTLAAAP